jgi:hypothetical protein
MPAIQIRIQQVNLIRIQIRNTGFLELVFASVSVVNLDQYGSGSAGYSQLARFVLVLGFKKFCCIPLPYCFQ